MKSEPPVKLKVVPLRLQRSGMSLQFGPAGSPENTAPSKVRFCEALIFTRAPGADNGAAGPPLSILAPKIPAQPNVLLSRPP